MTEDSLSSYPSSPSSQQSLTSPQQTTYVSSDYQTLPLPTIPNKSDVSNDFNRYIPNTLSWRLKDCPSSRMSSPIHPPSLCTSNSTPPRSSLQSSSRLTSSDGRRRQLHSRFHSVNTSPKSGYRSPLSGTHGSDLCRPFPPHAFTSFSCSISPCHAYSSNNQTFTNFNDVSCAYQGTSPCPRVPNNSFCLSSSSPQLRSSEEKSLPIVPPPSPLLISKDGTVEASRKDSSPDGPDEVILESFKAVKTKGSEPRNECGSKSDRQDTDKRPPDPVLPPPLHMREHCYNAVYRGCQGMFLLSLLTGLSLLASAAIFHRGHDRHMQVMVYIGVVLATVSSVLLVIFCAVKRTSLKKIELKYLRELEREAMCSSYRSDHNCSSFQKLSSTNRNLHKNHISTTLKHSVKHKEQSFSCKEVSANAFHKHSNYCAVHSCTRNRTSDIVRQKSFECQKHRFFESSFHHSSSCKAMVHLDSHEVHKAPSHQQCKSFKSSHIPHYKGITETHKPTWNNSKMCSQSHRLVSPGQVPLYRTDSAPQNPDVYFKSILKQKQANSDHYLSVDDVSLSYSSYQKNSSPEVSSMYQSSLPTKDSEFILKVPTNSQATSSSLSFHSETAKLSPRSCKTPITETTGMEQGAVQNIFFDGDSKSARSLDDCSYEDHHKRTLYPENLNNTSLKFPTRPVQKLDLRDIRGSSCSQRLQNDNRIFKNHVSENVVVKQRSRGSVKTGRNINERHAILCQQLSLPHDQMYVNTLPNVRRMQLRGYDISNN